MGELTLDCLDAASERYAVAPTLSFRLRVTDSGAAPVQHVALRCQLRIEPQRRTYTDAEAGRLRDLFGERPRWGSTLKPMQLASVPLTVPPFTGHTEVDLPVPCSYDMEVATSTYFHALDDGEIPLLLLFSGTVFRTVDGGGFVVDPIPWRTETSFRMPVGVWRDMMNRHFPDGTWLRLHRDTLDALGAFKSRRALPGWDEALLLLLDTAGER